jgi:solute carrier family 25 S-adenosylmethionine transporter 26
MGHGTLPGSIPETAVITAISSGSAGSVAAALITPVDVVKIRIMLAASGEISRKQAKKEIDKARRG